MTKQPIRIGARGSKLSVAQAETVRAAIARALGDDAAAELVLITTTGDRIQDRTLAEIGGKGLFTQEIEAALLDGRIDAAVHSLKDMPTELPAGLTIAATPAREDPRDAFVSERFASLEDLPDGATLGTASLRRQAQALRRRPDLRILALRGNVDTRLAKLARGEFDAILVAAAGLNRLGLETHIRGFIHPRLAPPAPGQGALAIETRIEDRDAPWLAELRCRQTTLAVAAERGALAALDGSCRTAIGAYATLDGVRLTLAVEALSPDGRQSFADTATLEAADEAAARAFGLKLGGEIKAQAGDALEANP
jgi:hydroxymethylbilane synthase